MQTNVLLGFFTSLTVACAANDLPGESQSSAAITFTPATYLDLATPALTVFQHASTALWVDGASTGLGMWILARTHGLPGRLAPALRREARRSIATYPCMVLLYWRIGWICTGIASFMELCF